MDAAVAERPRILYVDDEAVAREAFLLMAGAGFDVRTAATGEEGLALMARAEPFAAVISDNHMPGMSGAAFLQAARDRFEETVRILLTGHGDLDAAIDAVNRGSLFRFLLKPSTRDLLRQTLDAAVAQHRLVIAERELLQKTLLGSMRALLDVLSVVDPVAFGRVGRLKDLSLRIACRLGLKDSWQLEYAALASQLGYVALPDATLRKVWHGSALTELEQAQLSQATALSARIVGHIPRLGRVGEILRALTTCDAADGQAAAIEARILKAVAAFKAIEQTAPSRAAAVALLRQGAPPADASAVAALIAELADEPAATEVVEIPIARITVGMTVLDDVYTRTGALLIARGTAASESFVARLRNIVDSIGPTVVRVTRG